MENLILPVIHMNGTGARILTRDYDKAYSAIETAIEIFIAIEFNARDYYPTCVRLGNNAFEEARQQRRDIKMKLEEIRDYLEQHLIHINQ